jgi:hypothetical protein
MALMHLERLQPHRIRGGRGEVPVDAGVARGARDELVNDGGNRLLLAQTLVERFLFGVAEQRDR